MHPRCHLWRPHVQYITSLHRKSNLCIETTIMPRVSRRTRALEHLNIINTYRIRNRIMRLLFDEDDESADAVDLVLCMAQRDLESNRYFDRPAKYRKGSAEERFETDLRSEEEESVHDSSSSSESEVVQPWLNDDEFLQKYRVSRESFHYILNKIENHPIFGTAKNRKQRPVKFQLLTWLHFAGTEGTGGSNSGQRNNFGIGYGTADLYRNRVAIALASLADEYITWPDEEERQSIALEIF